MKNFYKNQVEQQKQWVAFLEKAVATRLRDLAVTKGDPNEICAFAEIAKEKVEEAKNSLEYFEKRLVEEGGNDEV